MNNISLCVIFILLCFYLGWHKRYKTIIENYERRLHSGNLLIIIIYMFLSLFLLDVSPIYSIPIIPILYGYYNSRIQKEVK